MWSIPERESGRSALSSRTSNRISSQASSRVGHAFTLSSRTSSQTSMQIRSLKLRALWRHVIWFAAFHRRSVLRRDIKRYFLRSDCALYRAITQSRVKQTMTKAMKNQRREESINNCQITVFVSIMYRQSAQIILTRSNSLMKNIYN